MYMPQVWCAMLLCWWDSQHTFPWLVCCVSSCVTLPSCLCNFTKVKQVWASVRFEQTSCEIYTSKCEIYTCYIMCKKKWNTCLKKSDFYSVFFFNVFPQPPVEKGGSLFFRLVFSSADDLIWSPNSLRVICVVSDLGVLSLSLSHVTVRHSE